MDFLFVYLLVQDQPEELKRKKNSSPSLSILLAHQEKYKNGGNSDLEYLKLIQDLASLGHEKLENRDALSENLCMLVSSHIISKCTRGEAIRHTFSLNVKKQILENEIQLISIREVSLQTCFSPVLQKNRNKDELKL